MHGLSVSVVFLAVNVTTPEVVLTEALVELVVKFLVQLEVWFSPFNLYVYSIVGYAVLNVFASILVYLKVVKLKSEYTSYAGTCEGAETLIVNSLETFPDEGSM